MDMCRFRDRNDAGYQQVGGELRLLVEKLDQERILETNEQGENASQHREGKFLRALLIHTNN
jgi:hypothetical protein